MRTAGAAGRADFANYLALFHHVAFAHQKFGAVQECAVKAHAVVYHQKMPLQSKGVCGGEGHDSVGGSDKRGAGGRSYIHSAVVAARRPVVDSLRPEKAGNSAGNWPDKILAPSVAVGTKGSGFVDTRELRATSRPEFF